MKRKLITPQCADAFDVVRDIGLTLPGVEASTRYDGSPVLKLGGVFLAGLAMHVSAEPDTLVVRYSLEDREYLLDDAPKTYYLTEYYRPYPLVLVRLSQIKQQALRDVLTVSWRLTSKKVRRHRPRQSVGSIGKTLRGHPERDRA